MRIPKLVTGGLIAVALTAAVGGAALAQTPPAPGTPRAGVQQRADEFLNAVAAKLGKSPADVRAAVVAVQKERVAAEVAAGRLTQEQANRMIQKIEQSGGLGAFHAPKIGPGPKGRPGPGPGPGAVMGGPALAQFLGLQPQELMQALRDGKSLAQIAQEKGKTRDDLKSFLLTEERNRLTQAVQAGRLTQQQADEMLARLTAKVDSAIDRTHPPRGPKAGERERGPGRGPQARPPGGAERAPLTLPTTSA